MNVTVFGKIITGLGLAIMLLGVVPSVLSLPKPESKEQFAREFRTWGRTATEEDYAAYRTEIRTEALTCIVGKIGHRSCQMSGYTAVFTYVGIVVIVLGGGLVLASRKTEPSSSLESE